MPKIKYRDLASALRQDLGQDAANIDDVSLVQAWITDNPQYKDDVIFDGQVGRIAKRTGNLLEDLKTAEPLSRTAVAPQRGRSGLEAPMLPPFTGGFVGGEMAAPQRPAEDIEFLPTTFSNTLEGQQILDFTKGKKDVESIRDYFTSVAQEGAVGSESKSARTSALKNALDVNLRFAEEQYNDLYPDAPLSWGEFMTKYSDPQLQQDREILGQELTSLFGKMKYYEAMGDEQSYNQTRQSAEEIGSQYESLFGEFEQVLQVASPLLEQVNQYGQELNQLNEEANKEAQDIEETNFFGKAALSLSRFGTGLGYVAADLFSTLGATGIGDKMKSGLMDSQISTKDPRMAAFKAPYDSKKGGFTGGVGNAVGFIFEQGLNMIPAIAAFSTPYGRVAQTALATIGTTATTYDEYANEIDRAAIETGAKIDPQTRAALAGMASLKTGLIENVVPINKFVKLGMAKSFADNAVRALASGKGLEVAIRGAYQASKAFAAAQGVEITEEIIDQVAQEAINESVRNQMAGLEQSEQFAPRPAELSDYKDIVVNTAIAVTPLAGVGFISNGARFKEDLYHHVGRKGDIDSVMDLFEENKDKFKGESYKKNTDRLKKVSNVYESIPQEFDDINARKVADNMLEIDRLDGQINNRTSPSQLETIEKKITKLQGEIDQIYKEEQERTDAGTATQVAPVETSQGIELQIPESDQNVLNVISERIDPILNPLTQRMTNAEEIDMAEIEAVAEQMIDEQTRILESENLSEAEKQSLSQLIELQIDNLLDYEFATITTTEQTGKARQVKGVVRFAKPGLPQKVSTDRFFGTPVTNPQTGERGFLVLTKVPITQSRTGLKYQFISEAEMKRQKNGEYKAQQGLLKLGDDVSPSTPFTNMEYVSSNFSEDGNLTSVVLRDAQSGNEIQVDDQELALDIAIAESQRQIGTVPEGALLSTIQRVVPVKRLVKIFPNIAETGTTPAAVGVEPQTEQDVRQETNAPQEGRGQGEDVTPVPQEEGRQEGQVTPPAVAQEGETPPATGKKTRKTEQQKADERNAAEEELRKALGVLQAGKKKPLFQRPGQKAEIDEDTQIELASEEAGISPKNFRDLYRVNRELFGLNQSEAMSAAIAMDKMIGVMAKRAGVSKTEMYGRLNFKKATEQDLPQSAIKQDKEEILRVFHGTSKDKDFKKFKDTGKGVFVTISPKEASEYAEQNDSMKFGDYDPITRRFREINTASRVIPMNLNLGNSYKLTKADIEFLNSKPNYSALQKELHARIKANGFDTIDYGNGVYAVLTEGRLRSMLTNEALFQKDLPQGVKFQVDAVKARGAMMIALDGQATIYALTDPNVSTPLHELAHVFEHYLTDEEKATVQEWAKTKDWTIKTSEAFARGFEKYLAEGKAPTPALQKIFDNFKQWLTDIYRGIVGSDIDVELNEPMRDLYAKMFEFTGEDGQSNFEKWKGDNNLLVGPDIQDAKTGEPIVVRAYHGTTNEFYEFDSSVKGSVEGHLGKINYFTSDYQDAAINYLSEGTDLTNRVEGRTEQIISELENNYDDYNESIPELSKKYGYTEEELEDDFVSFRSLARDLAKKELYGGTNKVLDVFIKLNNPVVLGKGSTWFQTLNISEADLDQAAQEIADENDISVEEAKQDYDFDIRDRAIENSGYENLAVDALSSALRSNGYRGASASEILGDNLYESEIDLNRLEGELRRNDKAGLYENEEGELASSQVVSDFLKNLGFDGIILTDVSSRFRGMGLGSSTSHIHVFDEFANQIKLADGSNTTFGETRDIRFQLDKAQPQQQAQPEAQVDATAKALEDALAPDDAFEMYRLSHVSDKGFVLQKSWIEEKLIELLPKIGARRFASLVREYVDEYFSASILKTPGMSFGELIGYLIGDGNLVYQGTETKWAELLKSQGVDVPSPKPGNVTYNPIRISEAYHKAKADGSNPKLVQAVDELLGQTPEAKPAKTIAEQRKEFRETAKKYFDGLKKMGIAFDPEGNSKEDIAFLKALAKYIKLELDNGMVTFKGFLEKTSNLIEGFNEAAVVSAAKQVWAKEVVKAYPKVYSGLQKAKKALLNKELQEARATLQGNLTKLLSDQKIFKQISSLTTERKLDKSSSDILIGIREEIEALGGVKKLSDEQLLSYNEIVAQTYKDGRINQGQLIGSLDAQKAADEKNAKSAITNQNERSVVEFKDANEAREFLSQNRGNNSNQVSINNGEIIVDSVEEFDILSSMFNKRTTFGGTTTAPNPNNVKRGKRNFYRTTVGGGLIYLLDKLKGKTPSQETIEFFNRLQDQVKAGTFQKKRLNAELNKNRGNAISRFFGNRFAYTRRMLSTPMINGEKLIIKDQNGKEITKLNVNNVLFFYQLMKDPHFLKKDGKGERKIGLSEQSMRDIVDFVNLKENDDIRELMNNDQALIKRAAQTAAQVMEENNISSELLNPRTLNLSEYKNDDFIGEILNRIYNNSVPSEIEYFPSSVESEMNNQVPDVDALLDEGLGVNAVSAMSRFMIERVSGGKVKVKSYDAQLSEYFDSMSNTAAKLPILKRFQSVFNKENSDLISSYFGKNTTEELRENIGRYITSRQQDSWLIRKTSEGALGKWLNLGLGLQMFFNFGSAFSQLASFPGPILSYGITNYLDGLSMLISGKADLRDSFTSLKSGLLLQERLGSRIDAAAIVKSIPSDERGFYAYVNQFNKALISLGAAPSAYFDAASIMLSLPIYAREYENARKTMTRKEAKDYAEEKTMDLAESFLQTKNEEMMSSAESRYRTTLYSFATIVPQLHRQAIMAVKRIQRGEGDLVQNMNVFIWSAIGSSVAFRLLRPLFESIFEGDDEDEELKKLRGDKRARRVALDLAVDATKSFGLYGAIGSAILKTGYQLVEAEQDASKVRMALDITPELIESVPSVSIKLRNISDAIRSYYDDENLRGTTQGIQALTGMPTERSRMLAVQMSDGFLSDSFTMMERVARLSGFISENKAKEKLFQKAMSTDPLLMEKLSPTEKQKFESKQKSEYKSATSIIARQYSEATTESERDAAIARLISLQSGATKYDKAEELVRQIQDDFDKKVYENALPKEFLEIKKMPSTKRVNFVADEFNAIKDEQEAMDYLETLSTFDIISENEKSEIVDILLKSNRKK